MLGQLVADACGHSARPSRTAGRPSGPGSRVGVRAGDVDVGAADGHPVPAGVGDQRLRRVEAHRLGAQQRRAERRRVVQLEPGRIEDERGEATARATRRSRSWRTPAAARRCGRRPRPVMPWLVPHAVVEPGLQPLHLRGGPLGAHRPAQLVGLAGVEAGDVDGELHQLLLEQRDAQRLGQRLLHHRVVVGDRLLAVAAADVRVHRVALDRAGADQRDLDHQVVEGARFQPGQGGHLRAGLDLEHARPSRPAAASRRPRGPPGPAWRSRPRCPRARGPGRRRSAARTACPGPSRSNLTRPIAAQSSLSHCSTERFSIRAHSTGQTSRPAGRRSPCRRSGCPGAAGSPGSVAPGRARPWGRSRSSWLRPAASSRRAAWSRRPADRASGPAPWPCPAPPSAAGRC